MRSVLHYLMAGVLLGGLVNPAWAGSIDSSHPDRSYQALGLERVKQGNYGDALRFFRMASRFADKTSQMSIAMLHYEGLGTPVDKAAAYAWSDLAAERGYPAFLATRERIWGELDSVERKRALALGAALYGEYADRIAKPRLEARLNQGYRRATGSRTGAVDRSMVVLVRQGAGGAVQSGQLGDGSMGVLGEFPGARVWNYYSDARWKPAEYWPLVDSVWMPAGEVTVGDLKPASAR